MKQFSRVFALLLAACMLLTSLSLSVWADGPADPQQDPSPEIPANPSYEEPVSIGEPVIEPGDGQEGVLRLPASLITIEADAFYGDSSLSEVVLPEGLQSIGQRAFAQSSLKKINLPASLGENAIADNAFDGVQGLTVTATAGTPAYTWAVGKGLIAPSVPINEANFPDAAFRNYVLYNLDSDWDEELSAAEIAAVKSLSLSWTGAQSLTGLAIFTELEYLECTGSGGQGGVKLTALDVSGNRKLKTLFCQNNALKTLDLSQNTALERLICIGNELETLDLSNNAALIELRCGLNANLTSLNLSQNEALQKLYCVNCNLGSLTLANNRELKVLSCDGNANLGSLSLGTNTKLEELSCAGCGLAPIDASHPALDLSQNTALIELCCDNNPNLGSLNVASNDKLRSLHCEGCGLSALDVMHNPVLSSLRCGGNANLSALALTNLKDLTELHCESTSISSLDISTCDTLLICWRLGTVEEKSDFRVYDYSGGHTAKGYIRMIVPKNTTITGINPAQASGLLISANSFPDPVLRAYVYDNFDEDQNYYLDADECAGAEEIRLSYRDVADLTGVANFPNLRVLECEQGFDNDGRLAAVNLSANTKLEVLNLTGHPGITTLDVTMLPDLRELCVGYTGLSTLNLTQNTKLEKLLVDDCAFTAFDLSKNDQLKELDCCGNEGLTALDISKNPKLVALYRLGGKTPDWCPPEVAENLIAYTGGDGTLVLARSVAINAGNLVGLASLTVGDVRRYETERVDSVYEQRNYNGDIVARIPFRCVNCDPDSVTVTLTNEVSETFTDLWSAAAWVKNQLNLSEDVYAWWTNDETPYYHWSGYEDTDHIAYANLGGLQTEYTVEVLANPVRSVSVTGGIQRYEFYRQRESGYEGENGWVQQEWDRIDCWPGSDETLYVCVELRDGRQFSGTAQEVWDSMNRAGYGGLMGWHSDETPLNEWTSGGSYTAWLDVGDQSRPFAVSVLADPVESLTVDPTLNRIERYSFDVEDRWGYEKADGFWANEPWQALSAWPDDNPSLIVTAVVAGKTYSGTANQVVAAMDADGWNNQVRLSWETDESPENRWQAGQTYTAV